MNNIGSITFNFRRNHIFAAIALIYAASPLTAFAEEAVTTNATTAEEVPASSQARLLQEVVISATRTEQDVNDVAATVTSVTDKDIEQQMPTDVKDLLRYETGVSVRSLTNRASAAFLNTGRGGNEGINIRGLEGDQVLLQSDGVRLPMIYDSGPYKAGRVDYIDVEAYKRVEILRGPASTQYGSDGLSGAVSFLTKDPQDLLTLGKPWQAALKTTYASVDNSWTTVPSFAYANDVVEAMLLASIRNGRETENMGKNKSRDYNRTIPSPTDAESQYILAKLILKPSEHHQFKLTVEDMDRDVDANIRSFRNTVSTTGVLASSANITNVDTTQDITRQLYKLDYAYDNGKNRWFQRLHANLYRQDSDNEQYAAEESSMNPVFRTRTTTYAEEVVGGSLQMESNFGDNITHRLVYGLDASFTDITSFKDGYNSPIVAGLGPCIGTTCLPFVQNKAFPDTDYRLYGAFIQDEINVGQFSIIPGLRWDRFELKPHADDYYRTGNTVEPTELSDDEISPKLGTIWKISPMVNVFAQYAHGFRAPKPTHVNGGVTNLTAAAPYTSIGNPNLKPETSDSIELGIRGQNDRLRYSATAFKGKYKDFIAENRVVGGSGTVADPTIRQSINLSNVGISGYELRGEWAFNDHWSTSASFAHAKGDSKENGLETPLETIDPNKLVLGLRYDKENRYGAQLMVTAVERKKRSPYSSITWRPNPPAIAPAPVTSDYHNPSGFEIVDIIGYYQFNKNFSVNGGVFNIFDRKYLLWSDVRGITELDRLGQANPVVDSLTQPGRNASISFKYQF